MESAVIYSCTELVYMYIHVFRNYTRSVVHVYSSSICGLYTNIGTLACMGNTLWEVLMCKVTPNASYMYMYTEIIFPCIHIYVSVYIPVCRYNVCANN